MELKGTKSMEKGQRRSTVNSIRNKHKKIPERKKIYVYIYICLYFESFH